MIRALTFPRIVHSSGGKEQSRPLRYDITQSKDRHATKKLFCSTFGGHNRTATMNFIQRALLIVWFIVPSTVGCTCALDNNNSTLAKNLETYGIAVKIWLAKEVEDAAISRLLRVPLGTHATSLRLAMIATSKGL